MCISFVALLCTTVVYTASAVYHMWFFQADLISVECIREVWLVNVKFYVELVVSYISIADFFRGPKIKKIRLTGIEHVLSFTAHAGKIYLRCYK